METEGRGEFTGGGYALPSGKSMRSADERGMNPPGELGVWVKTTIDLHQDRA